LTYPVERYEQERQEYMRKWLADRKAAAARAKALYDKRVAVVTMQEG